MTDGVALIRSVLASPADDAPRLVYADWLEERGRAEDAEFIRVQVELARLGFDGAFHVDSQGRLQRMPAHIERLQERQLELWSGNAGRPDVPDVMANWPMFIHPMQGQGLRVRRGFVERIASFTDIYLEVAGGLFARQPVTHVRLVDLMPRNDKTTGEYDWDFVGSMTYAGPRDNHVLPAELAAYIPDFDHVSYQTADEAEAALSWICVRYGRAAAGQGDNP